MIALDTNVLVRFLVADDADQAEAARGLLSELTTENAAFVCREVIIELVWVLERAYGFSRDRIATTLEALVGTQGLRVETADDVVRAAHRYRLGGVGFADLMIAAYARSAGAERLYTFDRKLARLDGAALLLSQTS